jgi:hypothetical protein
MEENILSQEIISSQHKAAPEKILGHWDLPWQYFLNEIPIVPIFGHHSCIKTKETRSLAIAVKEETRNYTNN